MKDKRECIITHNNRLQLEKTLEDPDWILYTAYLYKEEDVITTSSIVLRDRRQLREMYSFCGGDSTNTEEKIYAYCLSSPGLNEKETEKKREEALNVLEMFAKEHGPLRFIKG